MDDQQNSRETFFGFTRTTQVFFLLAGFFIANTLVAEFIGIKIFSMEDTLGIRRLDLTLFGQEGLGLDLTAGVVLWPIVFIMTDIINEYFGVRKVKFLSYTAIGLVIYSFVMIYVAIGLEPNEWWRYESGQLASDTRLHIDDMHLAFNKVMGQGLWIIVGSMIAFLIGQIVDVYIFHRIKSITGEGKVWLRANGSTFVSQFIDSYVVLIVAFYIGSDWSLMRVLAIGTVNLTYKVVVAILLTPLIYLAHMLIDRYLGDATSKRLRREAAKIS